MQSLDAFIGLAVLATIVVLTSKMSALKKMSDDNSKETDSQNSCRQVTNIFENPMNGYRETAGGSLSWLWVFLFGPIYLLLNGLIGHAIVWIIIVILFGSAHIALGIFVGLVMSLLYAMCIRDLLRKKFLVRGWREITSD